MTWEIGGFRIGGLLSAGAGLANRACRSHLDGLTLTVDAGDVATLTACDWEAASGRRDPALPLVPDCARLYDQLRDRCDEAAQTSRARLWTAAECMSKAGLPQDSRLVLAAVRDDGWVLLRSGDAAVASAVVAISGVTGPVAVAIMSRIAQDGTEPPARRAVEDT